MADSSQDTAPFFGFIGAASALIFSCEWVGAEEEGKEGGEEEGIDHMLLLHQLARRDSSASASSRQGAASKAGILPPCVIRGSQA